MYRVSDAVRTTHNQDGAMILNIRLAEVLRLNVTGSAIFQRLQKGESELQIIEAISQEFQLSPTIARADVNNFLKSLEHHGLIYRIPSEMHP